MKITVIARYSGIVALSLLFTLGGFASDTKLPSDAQRLVEKREQAMQQIDQKFVSELEILKVEHTKRGNLESANAIVDLIRTIEGDKNKNHIAQLKGTWQRDKDGRFFEFDGNGGGLWNGRDRCTVTYDPEKQQYTVKTSTWINYLKIGSDPLTLNGSIPNAYDYKLKKIK